MLENLTVVIPYRDGAETIHKLLMSLPRKLPVLIIDDCSESPLIIEDDLYPDSDIKVVRLTKHSYFAGAVNAGLKFCMTDVLVLNQDVWFENNHSFSLLESHRKHFGMIGERVRGNHPTFGPTGYAHGVFWFLRRDAIREVGLLNARDYPLWGATAEWQLRAARKGFSVLPLDVIPGLHHDRPKNEPYGSSIKELLEKEPQNREILVRTPPLLSVVALCYNYGHYLKDCLNSLIGGPTPLGESPGQVLQSFEVVIVNDASTDDSAKIIDELAVREKGIRAYHLERNVGTAEALNFGIRRSIGKYITFLSADDMRESDSLEKLVRCCEENPHSFAYDDIHIFWKNKYIKKWEMEEYDFEKTLYKNQVHAGIVFPRKAWEEVGGYPAIMGDGREDWAFNIALGIHGWCGVHVKNFGYLYRREGQNRTETNTSGYHMDYFRDKVQRLFPKIYGGYRPMACCGKGSNTARGNTASKQVALVSQNGARMASNSVGAAGMIRLQYIGRKMSSVWPGHVTNVDYIFGADKPIGWVDPRDAGEKGRNGFLNSKDQNGNFIFQVVVNKAAPVVAPVVTPEPVLEPVEDMVTVVKTGSLGPSEQMVQTFEPSLALAGPTQMGASLSVAEKTLDFPDPTDMNVEEIKRLDLSKDQWTEVYKVELANRSRKGAVAWLEEKLASFG